MPTSAGASSRPRSSSCGRRRRSSRSRSGASTASARSSRRCRCRRCWRTSDASSCRAPTCRCCWSASASSPRRRCTATTASPGSAAQDEDGFRPVAADGLPGVAVGDARRRSCCRADAVATLLARPRASARPSASTTPSERHPLLGALLARSGIRCAVFAPLHKGEHVVGLQMSGHRDRGGEFSAARRAGRARHRAARVDGAHERARRRGARAREPAQVRVRLDDVARAPHAAQHHHRLHRHAARRRDARGAGAAARRTSGRRATSCSR